MTKPTKTKVAIIQHQLPEQDATLALIERAARDPKIKVDKMRELLQMKRDHEADLREQRAEAARMAYQRDMIDAQTEMEPVVRKSDNPHTKSKYAKLEAISKAIKPIYGKKYGFALTYTSPKHLEDGTMLIGAWVLHREGHREYHELPGKVQTAGFKGNANMTELQGLGNLISYLRRYLTCMIFDVILTDEDNDGNHETPPGEKPDDFGQLVQESHAPKPVMDSKITVENDSGDWDGKTLIISGKPTVKEFKSPEAAAEYLEKVVGNHKSHASRAALVNDNLALIRALAKAGKGEAIQKLHGLVDAGEGASNVSH